MGAKTRTDLEVKTGFSKSFQSIIFCFLETESPKERRAKKKDRSRAKVENVPEVEYKYSKKGLKIYIFNTAVRNIYKNVVYEYIQ